MNKNSTAIAICLDKSGSMASCQEATIAGFNSTLKKQKAEPGEASLTLVVFSESVEIVQSLAPVEKIKQLTDETYVPSGGTALYDAIGETINHVGEKLAAMKEKDRPARVLVVIMTDGHENASRRFKKEQIMKMIKRQRDVYSWEFAFIGADLNAVEEAVSLGVTRGMSFQYTSSEAGTSQAHEGISKGMSNYRSGRGYSGKA